MGTWYTDKEGTLWRHSKFDGGMQAERPNGKFGTTMTLQDAVNQFDIEQLPYAEGLVLDQFDAIRVPGMDYDQFKALRQSVLEVVRYATAATPPTQIAQSEQVTKVGTPGE